MRALQYLAFLLIATFSMTSQASVAHHRGTLEAAAERVDVDVVTLMTVAHIESRGNAKARSKYSTAGGLMGFTDPTWRAYIKKYGKRYGFTYRTSKYNPRANALMAAHLMKDNEVFLRKLLKRQPTQGDIYIAFLLGEPKAKKLFKAGLDRRAAHVLPRAAAGNKKFFYTDKGKPRTVRQFRDYMNWRFTSIGEQYAKQFNLGEDTMFVKL